jgi:hypothetical protein
MDIDPHVFSSAAAAAASSALSPPLPFVAPSSAARRPEKRAKKVLAALVSRQGELLSLCAQLHAAAATPAAPTLFDLNRSWTAFHTEGAEHGLALREAIGLEERVAAVDLHVRRNIGCLLEKIQTQRRDVVGSFYQHIEEEYGKKKDWTQDHLRFGRACASCPSLPFLSQAASQLTGDSVSWTTVVGLLPLFRC